MPLSDAAKAHKSEYQSKKFSVISTSIPRETGEIFKQYCADRGLTVHAVLKEYIESCIQQNK